jgi:hypothetical protein
VLWYFEYPFLLAKLYLPWFPLALYGIFLAVRKARLSSIRAEALLLIWISVMIVPFSLADSKILRYILPVFPAFAIFCGYAIVSLLPASKMKHLARLSASVLALGAIYIVLIPNYRTRAEDMRTIAPAVDAAATSCQRVVLYSSGDLKWDYENQLLWYGHRNTILTAQLDDIYTIRSDRPGTVFVMDRPTFVSINRQFPGGVEVLQESTNFICFRFTSPASVVGTCT